MTKLEKFLRRLTAKRRAQIEPVIARVVVRDFLGLHINKLSGFDDRFRVRQGDIRIIFSRTQEEVRLLRVEFRGDTTYHF